jgi:hypothetical protein
VRDRKAADDDYIPGDVLKLLGEIGLRMRTQLMNNIHETGELPKDYDEVKIIAINKKPKTTKCSHYYTNSLIACAAKIVARMFRGGFEGKIEEVLEEDQFGFRRGEGSRYAAEMLRILSE